MRTRSAHRLVLGVAIVIAAVGTAFVRMSERSGEEVLRLAVEHAAEEGTTRLASKNDQLRSALRELAANISGDASTVGFERSSKDLRRVLGDAGALFIVSDGKLLAAIPQDAANVQFQGISFSDVVSKGAVGNGSRPLTQKLERLGDGGWVLLLAQELEPNRSVPTRRRLIAAIGVDSFLSSARIGFLSDQNRDYEIFYSHAGAKAESVLTTLRAKVTDSPVRRSVSVGDEQWTVAIAPRGGWFLWGAFLSHVILVLAATIAAAIFAFHISTKHNELFSEIEKRNSRLKRQSKLLKSEIRQRSDLERRFAVAGYHDSLTGLPNRLYFVNHVDRALISARRNSQWQTAVILVRFDRLQSLCESLGHAIGDRLLTEAAKRLGLCTLIPDPVLAKLGSNELGFLLPQVPHREAAIEVARSFEISLADSFLLDGHTVFATANIGIALSSPESDSADELVRGADIALHKAETGSSDRVQVFDPGTRDQVISYRQLETDLRKAIDDSQIVLHFQPIVCLTSGLVVGAEVLARWQHPTEGLLAPVKFIPLAEETGLIVPLNRAVMRSAFKQARQWRSTMAADRQFYLSFNLTAADLRHPDLPEFVGKLCKEYDLPRGLVRAEVTESGLINDVSLAIEATSKLREMGIPLLLDDFGTGYSSLSYLQLFKFDYLKIDMVFVRRITEAGENLQLVEAIVNMARSLGIPTISEGIETEFVLKHLQSLGCSYGQGYYFSKPVPAEAVEPLLGRPAPNFTPAGAASPLSKMHQQPPHEQARGTSA